MAEPSTSQPQSPATESLPVPGLPPDWHIVATDKIVATVDQVRVKTSGPAVRISRAVVFGLLGALVTFVALIIFVIGIVRLLDIALPNDVWLVYFVLGAVFVVAGGFLWSKRPRGAAS